VWWVDFDFAKGEELLIMFRMDCCCCGWLFNEVVMLSILSCIPAL
jgi:hypothetical protein